MLNFDLKNVAPYICTYDGSIVVVGIGSDRRIESWHGGYAFGNIFAKMPQILRNYYAFR
jgi:hypothetical protein